MGDNKEAEKSIRGKGPSYAVVVNHRAYWPHRKLLHTRNHQRWPGTAEQSRSAPKVREKTGLPEAWSDLPGWEIQAGPRHPPETAVWWGRGNKGHSPRQETLCTMGGLCGVWRRAQALELKQTWIQILPLTFTSLCDTRQNAEFSGSQGLEPPSGAHPGCSDAVPSQHGHPLEALQAPQDLGS